MHLFTYGSLMFAPVWKRVVRGCYQSRPARLHDFARFLVHGASYPGITAQAGARLDGLVYLDLAADDVARLDAFEGGEYARAQVSVLLEDGRSLAAQTYVFLFPEKLSAAPWEAERFDCTHFLRSEA